MSLTTPGPLPDGFEVLESEVRYVSDLNRIRVDTVRMPDGSVATREIVEHLDAVGAVVVDADDRVLLLRQYRHAFGRRFLELPAGKLDVAGEDPGEAMQRELAEEVQVRAERLEPLITYTNSAGWCSETTQVFLATDLRDVAPPEEFEATAEEADMEVVRVDLAEAVDMVRDGRIVDSKTVIGLLVVADRRAGARVSSTPT